MHKQYLLIKGKPEQLIISRQDKRIYVEIKKGDNKAFVLRIPHMHKDFINMLKENGYEIVKQRNASKVKEYKSISGHKVKVYGDDLLVEIKADTEEELFKEMKVVKEELKNKYSIDSNDKCKWICFR